MVAINSRAFEKYMPGIKFNCVGVIQDSGEPPLKIQVITIPGGPEAHYFSSWRDGCELKDGNGSWCDNLEPPHAFKNLDDLGAFVRSKNWVITWEAF